MKLKSLITLNKHSSKLFMKISIMVQNTFVHVVIIDGVGQQ